MQQDCSGNFSVQVTSEYPETQRPPLFRPASAGHFFLRKACGYARLAIHLGRCFSQTGALFMPEGDTVRKLAAVLTPHLEGAVVRHLRLRGVNPDPLAGQKIRSVFSKGKHLFFLFDNDLLLRSHLGLYGSWHIYGIGERWRKPERNASIVLETQSRVFVCFNAREIEILRARGFRLNDELARLGPDLTCAVPDGPRLARRARELLEPTSLLVDLLLDQRVASGIGNVYKSEVLFLASQHPARLLADTPDKVIVGLFQQASDLLRHNLDTGSRVTRFADDGLGDLWVYGRAGHPCFRCGAVLRRDVLGGNPRSTYWCPRCQGRMRANP